MEKKKVWWILGSILAVVLVVGLIISVIYRDKIFPDYVIDPTTSDDAKVLDDIKKGLGTLVNGDYTIEDSETMQADADCPTKNDQLWEYIWVKEYENVVVFYYPYKTDSGVIYPNIVFKKIVGNRLSIDGIMNATLECKRGGFLGAGKYKWDKAQIKLNFGSTPNYEYSQSTTGYSRKDNCISLTSTKLYYWNGYNHDRNAVSPSNKEIKLAREFVSKALLETVQNYFLKFGNLRLQTLTANGNEVYAYLNSYFAYLFNSCKTGTSGDNKLVNVNDFLAYDIPQSEQENYPIPESKKVDYPNDWQYYKMYKCDKYVRTIYLNYKAYDTKVPAASSDYERTVDCEVVPAQEKQYAMLLVKLRNYNNADLTDYDATKSPVTITFATKDETTKTIVFDNKTTFTAGEVVTLPINKTYSYAIKSNVLCFDNIEGSFEATEMLNELTLSFTYLGDATLCSIGLNVVGDIDLSAIDLSVTPVVIKLENTVYSYIITFDDNKYLSGTMYNAVFKFGSYTYTIVSDSLIFPTTSGRIGFDSENRTHLFNCMQNGQSISIKESTKMSYTVNGATFKFTNGTISVIAEKTKFDAFLAQYPDAKIELIAYSGKELVLLRKTIDEYGVLGNNEAAYIGCYNKDDGSLSGAKLDQLTYTMQIKVTVNNQTYLSNVMVKSLDYCIVLEIVNFDFVKGGEK